MRKILLAGAFLVASIGLANAQSGAFSQYPTVGVPANTECMSYGNNNFCNQYRPAGPTYLTGNETMPADTNLAGGLNPQTIRIPTALFAGGYGNARVITTNANVVMAAGESTLISNQTTATIASISLPPNPANNQIVRIVNAGSGVLTTTAIVVGATPTGTTIVGGAAPATLAVQTTGTQAAVADVAYMYQSASNIWYRIH